MNKEDEKSYLASFMRLRACASTASTVSGIPFLRAALTWGLVSASNSFALELASGRLYFISISLLSLRNGLLSSLLRVSMFSDELFAVMWLDVLTFEDALLNFEIIVLSTDLLLSLLVHLEVASSWIWGNMHFSRCEIRRSCFLLYLYSIERRTGTRFFVRSIISPTAWARRYSTLSPSKS